MILSKSSHVKPLKVSVSDVPDPVAENKRSGLCKGGKLHLGLHATLPLCVERRRDYWLTDNEFIVE